MESLQVEGYQASPDANGVVLVREVAPDDEVRGVPGVVGRVHGVNVAVLSPWVVCGLV